MTKFSNSELVDMLLIYGECGQNSAAARRRYAEVYPTRHLPGGSTFASVVQRVRDTGKLQRLYQEQGRHRTDNVLKAEDAILKAIDRDPALSTRQIARNLNVSQSTVRRALKEAQGSRKNYFNCERILALEPGDYQARIAFCQWLLDKYMKNNNFPSQILFTDEATFTNYGIVNIHDESDLLRGNQHQNQFAVNVWAGILNNSIIGPFILTDNVTEQVYLNFLHTDLQPLLEEIPISVRAKMWFQNEGIATTYFTPNVRRHLKQEFKDRWIGRGGPVAWPPHSSDLNPVEFFLWGYLKQIIYERTVKDIDELKSRIYLAANMIKEQNVLEKKRESLIYRANKCLQSGGLAFQHLL